MMSSAPCRKPLSAAKLAFGSLLAALLFSACPGGSASRTVRHTGAEKVPPPLAEPKDPYPEFPDEEFRHQAPTPEEPRPFKLPALREFTLGGQIQVYLLERHDLPVVTLELQFDGGSINDRKGLEGTASVCMSMLTEGTKDLDKLAYGKALADMASGISSSAGRERQSVSMYSLSKNFDETFRIFVDTLLDPGFRDTDFDRKIKRRVLALRQAKNSARSVSSRVFGTVAYGRTHPFGKVTTEDSLEAINLRDCRAHHKAYLRPRGARLFVAGDISEDAIRAKFSPLFKQWKGKPRKSSSIPTLSKISSPRIYFVDIPGAAQSSISVIHRGPKRTDKNFHANQMMVNILGGSFSSRINMNLREDKGYSYGARGGFSYNRHFGQFVASSSVRSDSTMQSLREILEEMSSMKSGSKAATEAELQREKRGAILGLPARFATGRQALNTYQRLVELELPMNTFDTYVQEYGAVELSEVQSAAAQLLEPGRSLLLVVGDASSAQIERKDGKDVPFLGSDKKPVTLLDALREMYGAKSLTILNADGQVAGK